MKKRLHDKKAGIAILAVLFILSLADVILRAIVFGNIVSTAANYGEVLMSAVFSLLLIIFALKGDDRVFHILCGVWLSYFVLEQLFGVPYIISSILFVWSEFATLVPVIALLCRLLGMICIIIIGALLVKYMKDGTICNKTFNILCIATVLMLVASVIIDVYASIMSGEALVIQAIMLSVLNNLSSIIMVFLFTFFAYDSAKAQLKKTDLTK